MLERLTELREALYHFIIKDTTQGEPDGRDAQGKVGGKGMELGYPLQALPSSFLTPQSVHQPGSSPNHVV